MPLTLTELVEAVAKYAGKPDAHSKAAYARDLALLRGRAKEVDANDPTARPTEPTVTPPVDTHVYTADEVWAKFLDAQDVILKARGLPYGRDGAERGGMSKAEGTAVLLGLGIPNAIKILEDANFGVGFFGDDTPGISQ